MAKDPTTESMALEARLRPAFMACSVIMVVIMLGLASILFIFHQSPYLRDLAECKIRMQKVGDALDRYSIVNDKYPDRLTELVPDYLPAALLHCPKDDASSDHEDYIYTKQPADASPEAILLTCERHKLSSKMPGVVLQYLKKGVVVPISAKNLLEPVKKR